MKQNMMRYSSLVLVAAACTVIWVNAGSLTPPAGPISPTMKDLATVEPRTALRNDFVNILPVVISFPGSYYLAEDIMALGGQFGIEISASNVTLDLRGFTIYGNLEVGSPNGIKVNGSRSNIVVHNGTVRDFTSDGIAATTATNSRFENLQLFNNGNHGIFTGAGCEIAHSVARSNQGHGIVAGSGSTISDCSSSLNGQSGFASTSGTINRCTAYQNTSHGITANGSLVSGCTTTTNSVNGIIITNGHVQGCTVTSNIANGIVAENSYVVSNFCRANPNGIVVTTEGSRIEGNNVTGSTVGYVITDSNNLIIRNSAYSNATDYNIVAGNTAGPIVTSATIAANSNPHANYEY